MNWRLGLQFYSKKVSIEGFSLCILRYSSEGSFLYKPSRRLLLSLRWKGFLTKPLTWLLLHCAFYSINQFILLSLFKEFDEINGVRKWITLNLGEWIYIFFRFAGRCIHSGMLFCKETVKEKRYRCWYGWSLRMTYSDNKIV